MPAAYSEPGDPGGYPSAQRIAIAQARAANADIKASGGSLGTLTAVNGGDVSPGAAATVVTEVTGVAVPANGKVIMYVSMEIDVKSPETGGATNLATFETRFSDGGPETIVDSLQEDLFLGAPGQTIHNVITMVSQTPALAAGTYSFDVAALSSIAASDNVPAGKCRLTIQVVGS